MENKIHVPNHQPVFIIQVTKGKLQVLMSMTICTRGSAGSADGSGIGFFKTRAPRAPAKNSMVRLRHHLSLMFDCQASQLKRLDLQ